MPNELKIGRVYRHFKGDFYLVEAVANDSETGEPFVVYRKLYGDGGLWLRPLAMFLSPVDRAKYPDIQEDKTITAFINTFRWSSKEARGTYTIVPSKQSV